MKIDRAACVLDAGEIHTWVARLDRGAEEIASMRATLTDDETARAGRFKFERDRTRFVAARAVLRLLLAAYLGSAPESVRFEYNRWGKPSLARGLSPVDLRFNLSHSHGLGVYGLTLERDLGIDLELLRADFATDEIAQRFFAPAEARALRSMPTELRTEAFFNCWTRKEAYVKARGEGLSIDLSSFEVSLRPGEPPRLMRGSDAAGWSFASLRLDNDFVVAIAAHGAGLRIAPPRWL